MKDSSRVSKKGQCIQNLWRRTSLAFQKQVIWLGPQGLVIKAKVPPAEIYDQAGVELLPAPLYGQIPRMAEVRVDRAYRGLKKWLTEILGAESGGGETLVDGRWESARYGCPVGKNRRNLRSPPGFRSSH
jgi:hypothetical protein